MTVDRRPVASWKPEVSEISGWIGLEPGKPVSKSPLRHEAECVNVLRT